MSTAATWEATNNAGLYSSVGTLLGDGHRHTLLEVQGSLHHGTNQTSNALQAVSLYDLLQPLWPGELLLPSALSADPFAAVGQRGYGQQDAPDDRVPTVQDDRKRLSQHSLAIQWTCISRLSRNRPLPDKPARLRTFIRPFPFQPVPEFIHPFVPVSPWQCRW
jgi:hypothetical protein